MECHTQVQPPQGMHGEPSPRRGCRGSPRSVTHRLSPGEVGGKGQKETCRKRRHWKEEQRTKRTNITSEKPISLQTLTTKYQVPLAGATVSTPPVVTKTHLAALAIRGSMITPFPKHIR